MAVRKRKERTLTPAKAANLKNPVTKDISAGKATRQQSSKETKPEIDQKLALAREISDAQGISFIDNRQVGGALWVNHLQEIDDIATKLKDASFRFHIVRGWWTK